MKTVIIFSAMLGSWVGNSLPLLWGDDAFSVTCLTLGVLGGFLGVWVGYVIARRIGGE